MNNIINMIEYGGYITFKDDEWLSNQRIAGKILSNAHSMVKSMAVDGAETKNINNKIEEFIKDNNCTPTFKGYKGFPDALCTSVNKEIAHGVSSCDKVLKTGDVVKFDVGVSYEGAIADAAFTMSVGEFKNIRLKILSEACRNALYRTIRYIEENIGKEPRVGDLGFIIKKGASNVGANVIKDLTGHGLEYEHPHWVPFIFNYGDKGKGARLFPGMTICIEPMMVYGDGSISIDSNGFSFLTKEIGVHFEHTIFIHEDRVEIITE